MKLYSIKPLEWTDNKSGSVYVFANGVFYTISEDWPSWELSIEIHQTPTIYVLCATLDEAKAKAQEDWNNRVSQYLTEYKEEK